MATEVRVERPAAPPPSAQQQPGAEQPGTQQPGTPPGRRSPVAFGELVAAAFAIALLGLMFLTKWYGVAGVPDPSAARPAVSTAVDAWHGLSIVRWVMLLTIFVAVGSVVLHVSQRSHGTQTDTSRLVTALASQTALLLIYRVLIALPAADRITDQKLGAVLALVCALGIALGGRESMLAHKASPSRAVPRRRRDEGAPAKIISDSTTTVTDRGRVK
jgi:hypothetical protein